MVSECPQSVNSSVQKPVQKSCSLVLLYHNLPVGGRSRICGSRRGSMASEVLVQMQAIRTVPALSLPLHPHVHWYVPEVSWLVGLFVGWLVGWLVG